MKKICICLLGSFFYPLNLKNNALIFKGLFDIFEYGVKFC